MCSNSGFFCPCTSWVIIIIMYRGEWALAWSSIPGLVKNARLGGLGPRARTTLGSRSHKDQSGAGGGGGRGGVRGVGGARAGGRGWGAWLPAFNLYTFTTF